MSIPYGYRCFGNLFPKLFLTLFKGFGNKFPKHHFHYVRDSNNNVAYIEPVNGIVYRIQRFIMNVFAKYGFSTNGWMGYILVVLLAGSCLAAWSCSSGSKDGYISGKSPGYSGEDKYIQVEKASPQGGILIEGEAEPPYVTEETESGDTIPVDGETAADDIDNPPSTVSRSMNHPANSPQFNRKNYEHIQPSLEMAVESVEGFFLIEGAEYITEESVLLKGDRFETYNLLLRYNGILSYEDVVSAYSSRLVGDVSRKDWTTDNGSAASFRIEGNQWNKVITILMMDDEAGIDIRVAFNRLFEH